MKTNKNKSKSDKFPIEDWVLKISEGPDKQLKKKRSIKEMKDEFRKRKRK